MTDSQISLVRSILKIGSGILISKGAIDQGKQATITAFIDTLNIPELAGTFLGIITTIWGMIHRNTPDKQPTLPGLRLLAFLALIVAPTLVGCASFKSTQTETQADGTVRSTVVKVRTFWDSKSDLSKLRASTTDKTQGLTVSGLSEASSGTNAVVLIEGVTRAAVQAAIGAAK